MGFIPISFRVPVTAQTIRSNLSAVVAGVAGATAEGTGRLAVVTGGAVPQKSPLAGAAANVAALRAQLEALLQAGGRFVCVHPYVHPVGDRRGEYSYLTPSDCVAALAGKIADPEDQPSETGGEDGVDAGNLAAVCVLLHAADHGPFAALLAAFNAVFPVTELQLAERRARQLITLEKDKRIIATAPKEPRWVASAPHRHGALCGMDSALGALVAQSEAFAAENASAEAELAALMQARVVHVAQLDAAWQALCSGLSGDAGLGWYLSGDAAGMARQLAAGGTPVSAYKLSAALCWVGAAERVAVFKEVFGL
ncbi:MAG: hypothetical protein ACK5JO_07585 [Halodesulfovibrio sp.]